MIYGQEALPLSVCKQPSLLWGVLVVGSPSLPSRGARRSWTRVPIPSPTQGNLCKSLLLSSCDHGNRLGYIKLD